MKTPVNPALMVSLALGLLATKLSAAGPNLKPGLWEITTTMEMPGTTMAMPPMTRTQCYTKKDVQDAKRVAPGGIRQDQNCALKDRKMTGNKMTWNILCQGKPAGSGTGGTVFKG